MTYSEEILVAARNYTRKQRAQLNRSSLVGCFYCCHIISPFSVETIKQWTEDDSGVCPRCGVDALIGNTAITPITKDFLEAMRNRWFSTHVLESDLRKAE